MRKSQVTTCGPAARGADSLRRPDRLVGLRLRILVQEGEEL